MARPLFVAILLLSAATFLSVNGQGFRFEDEDETSGEVQTRIVNRNEGDDVNAEAKRADGTGGGLLASLIDVHPTGDGRKNRQTSGNGEPEARRSFPHCCCTDERRCPFTQSDSGFGGSGSTGGSNGDFFDDDDDEYDYDDDDYSLDLVNSGAVSPRFKEVNVTVATRIVNNPPSSSRPTSRGQCRVGQRRCCYTTRSEVRRYRNTCSATGSSLTSGSGSSGGGNINNRPFVARNNDAEFRAGVGQRCPERVINVSGGGVSGGRKTCGQRSYSRLSNLKRGEASPDEFPWTCLVLKGNNEFVGACAIVPESRDNDIRFGSSKVITAAHKLKDIRERDLLKVRVMDYDVSGSNRRERRPHKDFTVRKITLHPEYNAKRLTNDIAVLRLVSSIDLTTFDGVNAACYPSCSDMFNPDTNCLVAGWGRNGTGPQDTFQPILQKVDVPLVGYNTCENRLKSALAQERPRFNVNRFRIDVQSELCAGGKTGKDACIGDGGAPLVCLSRNHRWHVVGLVTWGVGCAQTGVPAVYVDVFNSLDFVNRA